jgi:hypothetical protein
MDCGKTFPPKAMDFDHRPGSEKEYKIGGMLHRGISIETILLEIKKCDISLCMLS